MGNPQTFALTREWEIDEITTCGNVQRNYDEYITRLFILEDQAQSPHYHEPQWMRNVETFIKSRPEWAVIYILGNCEHHNVVG